MTEAMADIAVILHWPPPQQYELSLAELTHWWHLAHERSGLMTNPDETPR